MTTPMHQSIICVDVEGFGDPLRTAAHRVAVRDGVYRALRQAFAAAEIDWQSDRVQDTGDGALILIPPLVPKDLLVTVLPRKLAAALAEHNLTHLPPAQIRLRLAVHAGEAYLDSHGAVGEAVITASRLLDSAPLRQALAESSGTLAMIASGWLYDHVIRASASPIAEYRQVRISSKELETIAWITTVNDPYSSDDRTAFPSERSELTVIDDLMDMGSNQDVPAAAAIIAEGLDRLFQRLGPPPTSAPAEQERQPVQGGGATR